MNTFSDCNGIFTLYSNDICSHFEISAPGMNKIKFDYKTEYFPVSNSFKDINSLSNKTLKHHDISYKSFLLKSKKNQLNEYKFTILNFDSTKFNKAKFIENMEIKELKPLLLK